MEAGRAGWLGIRNGGDVSMTSQNLLALQFLYMYRFRQLLSGIHTKLFRKETKKLNFSNTIGIIQHRYTQL